MKKLFDRYLQAALLVVLTVAALLAFLGPGAGSPLPWLVLLALAGGVYLSRRGEGEGGFLAWKEEYAVGIEVIDLEHKRLLNLINNLQAAVRFRTGEEFERQALEELVDYTRYHFQREEKLMEQHGYPDLVGHKAQHDQMINQVDTFVRRYEERGRDALAEVADYLRLWLLQHINGTDKKYVPYLQEQGVR
ncbi:bacteriohemerythrin [Thioalbus denitrificans]|uniref:Hemerythrin n=1 Tax=Thioalbus denitrificans TaxID=547122 RepID=A0A369BXF5_9GAMM|nr:bacteriohemerythrin [Thioalbus denitrificans]RCX26382.1 hemerythrin [Thioalbus denitrificans]